MILDSRELELRHEELVNNPSARVPVCLALDLSGSMAGAKLQQLQEAVALFDQAVRTDDLARDAAELAIVGFNATARLLRPLGSVDRQSPLHLDAAGATAMGAGVMAALDLVEQAKRTYRQMGVDYYQPWLVLMTDGAPTDNIDAAAQRCRELVEQRKLTLFPIAIGDDANLPTLARFSPRLVPMRLQTVDIKPFFKWLSASVGRVSMSNPGDRDAAGIGEAEYKRMAVDWDTAMRKVRR